MKVGILTSYSNSLSNVDSRAAAVKFLAGPDNSGNIVYINVLLRQLNGVIPIETNMLLSNPSIFANDFDLILLPFSNMLSEYFEHPIAELICEFNLPVALVSVGAQAPLGLAPEKVKLSRDALLILEQAQRTGFPIGVRGKFSKLVLSRHGIESMIIGCPSVFAISSTPLDSAAIDLDKNSIVGNCTLSGNHRDLTASVIEFIVARASGYLLQDEARIIRDFYSINMDEIPFGSFIDSSYRRDLENKLFDYGYYNSGKYSWGTVRDFFRNKSFFSLSWSAWLEYLRSFDLSVGTRFHGNVAAMIAGVPAIFIPCDSRSLELIEAHRLPFVFDIEELESLTPTSIGEKIQHFYSFFSENEETIRNYMKMLGLNWKSGLC